MSIFSRLFRRRKSTEEAARDLLYVYAAGQGKLPPPNLGVRFDCECGVELSAELRHFNPLGGMQVMCPACGAITLLPPDILDHSGISAGAQTARLKDNWMSMITVTTHGRKS